MRAKKSKAESGMPADPDNSFKGIFSKDLPSVMYGFGDSSLDPVPESVEALEAIATEYVKDILTKAQHHVRSLLPVSCCFRTCFPAAWTWDHCRIGRLCEVSLAGYRQVELGNRCLAAVEGALLQQLYM